MAVSQLATRNRDQYMPAVVKCAQSLARRRPGDVVEGTLEGSVGFILQLRSRQMRLVDVIPHKESDERFARCFQQALDLGDQVMDVVGTPDGTVAVEWPYSLAVEK